MVRGLGLRNFKCFEELKLDFSEINILTGLNGVGKSTVMQSILLLGQSGNRLMTEKNLYLKGKYIDLGVGQDILYEKAESDVFAFEIQTEESVEKYLFSYSADMDTQSVDQIEYRGNTDRCMKWADDLQYLSAYRIEPRFLYRLENEQDVDQRYFGKNGEYAIQYLQKHGEDDVANLSILKGDENGKTVADAVKRWMDVISPGVSPIININLSSRTAELQYEYVEGREKTNSYKSVNVGFGITYVLPIVVSLVSACPGEIILIENPEAHIHPRGQRMLGELIALAGAGGVQVIVETHSDHVVNGIRVAVKKGKVRPEQVSLFYFYKDTLDVYRHKVTCPVMDRNGRLNEWPEGLMDEWDNALLELL